MSTLFDTSPAVPEVAVREVFIRDHFTHIRDSGGGGAPVLLIHALSLDSSMWKFGYFNRLTTPNAAGGTPRRVVAYDIRGHGRAKDAPVTQSLTQLADDLNEVVKLLAFDKVDIIGVSYGGAVAQTFVLAYPDRVRSASFIATASTGHPIIADRATRAESYGLESLMDETLSRWFLPESIAAGTDCVKFAQSRLHEMSVTNWAAAWRTVASIDCLHRLFEIKVPVLILSGKRDTSAPPEMMRKMFEACRFGEYKEVSYGMHMFVMEAAEATSLELAVFLDRVDQTV